MLHSSRFRTRIRVASSMLSLVALAACSDKKTPTPPVIPGVLAVSVSPTSLTVAAGASGTSTATIVRGGTFTGAVTLTAEGAPSGVTVSFGAATVGSGLTTSSITVAVAGTVASGSYPIAIKGAGTGVTTAVASLSLTVTAVATPSVAVSVAPTTATVTAGGASASATATVARAGGFAGAVTLAATGAPANMTVAITPASIPADSTARVITVTAAGSVPAGNYPINITATGAGVSAATATLTVTVSPAVAGTTVNLAYCAADAPIWVAYQDGAGAWTRVTPSGTNTYSFPVASGKAGVATVDTVGAGFHLSVTYATTAELNGFGNTLGLGACGTKTVNGSVANVAADQLVNVALGYSSKFVIPITGSTFTLTGVASGPQDLFAARSSVATLRADKLILRRALDIAEGGSIPVLDFNAAEAFAPATANATVSGLGADSATLFSVYSGTRGSASAFIGTSARFATGGSAVQFDAIPAAKLSGTELQGLYAIASEANSTAASRFAGVYYRSPADRAIAMGPALAAPTVSRLTGGGYARVRVQLSLQTEYNRYFTATFSQAAGARNATVSASAAYLAGAPWDLSVPALTGISGWLDRWGLLSGTPIDWSVSAMGGAVFQLDPTVADGTTFRSAIRSSASPLP